MFAKSPIVSRSARAGGATPAARRTSAARCAGQSRAARTRSAASCDAARTPRRRPRRPENSRPAERRRLSPLHRDESRVDMGSRPEDGPSHLPGLAYVAVPGRLRARDAVDPRAGRRCQPGGDLELHHHQAPAQGRQRLPEVQEDGDRDVVGQVRDECGRRGLDPAVQRVTMDDGERGRPGPGHSCGHRGRAGPVASRPSISTAVTAAPAASRPSVSEPRPGPTSMTLSPGVTRAALTIRRTVLASMTKFCPRCLVGRMPNRSASRRTSAGPRSLGPADAEGGVIPALT